MGKKGSWLSSIKKVLSPNSKKSKKKVLGDEKPSVSITKPVSESRDSPLLPPPQEVKPIEVENEPKSNIYSATAATTEPTRLTGFTQYSGKSKEELASIRIQTAFRGYLVYSHDSYFKVFVYHIFVL